MPSDMIDALPRSVRAALPRSHRAHGLVTSRPPSYELRKKKYLNGLSTMVSEGSGGPAAGYMYESIPGQGEHASGVDGGNSCSRRRAVATLVGVAVAVCCVATTAVASGRTRHGSSSYPQGRKSALGMKKLFGSSSSNTRSHLGILNLDDDDEIVLDSSWGYGRESFGLQCSEKKSRASVCAYTL